VDKALQQDIGRLAVKCSFHAKGCDWTATLNELQVTNPNHVHFQCFNIAQNDFAKGDIAQGFIQPPCRGGVLP